MAKNQTHRVDAEDIVDDVPDRADMGALADTFVDRGRAVLDQFPAVADGARDVLAGAQDQVNGLSDMGIVAASGFALGVSSGLLLAGAPRAILILSTSRSSDDEETDEGAGDQVDERQDCPIVPGIVRARIRVSDPHGPCATLER